MAADIIKLDLAQVNDYISGAIRRGFELVSWADDSSIVLASGRVETVGEYFYQVQGGDLTITDSGIANGTVYCLIKDDGDGTASAYMSTKSGTYDPNKGGYYISDASGDDGAKVLFQMIKSSSPSVYSRKARTWPNWPGGELEKARNSFIDVDERITAWALIF